MGFRVQGFRGFGVQGLGSQGSRVFWGFGVQGMKGLGMFRAQRSCGVQGSSWALRFRGFGASGLCGSVILYLYHEGLI